MGAVSRRIVNMKYLLLTLAALVAVAHSSSVAEEAEQAAFTLCDNDGNGCLSWPEVDECEHKYELALKAAGLPLPSEEDFDASDLNGDGCLHYEEWLESNGLLKTEPSTTPDDLSII